MHKLFFFSLLLFLTAVAFSLSAQDEFVAISGRVVDDDSGRPVASCNVYIKDRNIGTVANQDGEFTIKIPLSLSDRTLVFSSIGYESHQINISALAASDNEVALKPSMIVMNEVVVMEAEAILRTALSRMSVNYPPFPERLTSFYRELIKKNNHYVDISQGILHLFKHAYTKSAQDQVKIHKGYRSHQYKARDTLVFKLEGGPYTMLLLDVVKNPGLVLSEDLMQHYAYELTDIREFEGKQHYEISFKPRSATYTSLYEGKIFVEEKSMAISQVEFGYPSSTVKLAAASLVKSKPKLARLTPLQVSYQVKYREIKGRWHIHYVKSELAMRCNWKKRLFNSTFRAVLEMVVTDRQPMSALPFEKSEVANQKLIFSSEAPKYFDGSFWENFSIIKPEDDIIKSLKKINSP